MDPGYQRLLALLKQPDSAVRAAYRVGSRVYGTASPGSDHDYVVVLSNPGQRQDLLFGDNVNVVLHGTKTFEAALEEEAVPLPASPPVRPPAPPRRQADRLHRSERPPP